MSIEVNKELESRFRRKLRSGRYGSADELLDRALSSLDLEDEFRRAATAGIAQAERGELIAGDEVFAELDALLNQWEAAEKAG